MTRWWPTGFARFLVGHPREISVVVGAAWALRRDRWWRHVPFLPLPYGPYWEFRLVTVNGSPSASLTPRAVVEASRWTRQQRVGL